MSLSQRKSNISVVVTDIESEDHPEVEPATNVTIHNAYIMGPAFGMKFPLKLIRYNIERAVRKILNGKTYAAADASKWAREVVDKANTDITGMTSKPRYKHCIQAVIFQQNGSGCFCGARAIWDPLSDDYDYFTYDGGTFVCIVLFFGLYTY